MPQMLDSPKTGSNYWRLLGKLLTLEGKNIQSPHWLKLFALFDLYYKIITIPGDFSVTFWSKLPIMVCYSCSVFLRRSHSDTPTHTHTSSHAFPCSGPGLVSPYFLSWLQAVSFFRSCIYPLGKLTSFEQGIINSISTLFPKKSVSTVQAKHRFLSAVVRLHLVISVSEENVFRGLEFCLISSEGVINVSKKMLIPWKQRCTAVLQSPTTGYSNQPSPETTEFIVSGDVIHSGCVLVACNYCSMLKPPLNQTARCVTVGFIIMRIS